MLKKSFSAFQAPLPPCDINNTNKNNSRVHTSNRLSDRDPNTLAQCVLCRGELFFSPLPQPAVGWDVAAVCQRGCTQGTGMKSGRISLCPVETVKTSTQTRS